VARPRTYQRPPSANVVWTQDLGPDERVRAILAGNPKAPNLRARTEAVRRAAGRYQDIEVVTVVRHVETPQDAATEMLKLNAAQPDLAGWAMAGGWPLFRSSQTPNLVADLEKRKQKVVAVGALPDELTYVDPAAVPLAVRRSRAVPGLSGVARTGPGTGGAPTRGA
jgi:ribose transport system substrate-binding protein